MKVNRNLCDVCGTCVAVCPVDAIIVKEFKIVINEDGERVQFIKFRKPNGTETTVIKHYSEVELEKLE